MSYAFDLRFRDCHDRTEAFDHALRATEALWVNLNSFLDEQKYYIPSLRYGKEDRQDADEAWLESVCQLRFIWWEDHKLLAIVGNHWPKLIKDIFPRYHDFQNSCDQNYDYDTWNGLSPQIMRHVNFFKRAGMEACNAVLGYEPDDLSDLEYMRKSALYQVVYDDLALDAWLWGRDDPKFMRFTLSCLTTQERKLDARLHLKAIVRKEKESEGLL